MAYFKIGDTDYSMYVNELIVKKDSNYNAQTNAAGNTVVDYVNHKRKIEVGIIPLDDIAAAKLLTDVDAFSVSITFRNPQTNALEENIPCIIPSSEVEYYTIQSHKVMFKAFKLVFTEL